MMNVNEGLLHKLTMQIEVFKLGMMLEGFKDNLPHEYRTEIVPVALNALEASLGAENKAARKQIHAEMKSFFLEHQGLISASDMSLYYKGIERLLGKEKAQSRFIKCLEAHNHRQKLNEFLQNPEFAKTYYAFKLKKNGAHPAIVKSISEGFALDPKQLTLQDFRKIQEAGLSLIQPGLFEIPILQFAIESCNALLLELLTKEDLPAAKLVSFFLTGFPALKENLQKQQRLLLGNAQCVGKIISWLVDLVKDSGEPDFGPNVTLLRQLIRTSPRIDPYALDVNGVLYLHRSGFFMTSPGLFSLSPLHAACFKCDLARILAYLEEEKNYLGLKSLKPEQLSPLFKELLTHELSLNESAKAALIKELSSLGASLDLSEFKPDGIWNVLQKLREYKIPLNQKGLFKQHPLKYISELNACHVSLLVLLVKHHLSWDEVPVERRKFLCLILLENDLIKNPIDSNERREVLFLLRSLLTSGLNIHPSHFTMDHFQIMAMMGIPLNLKGLFTISPLLDKYDRNRIEFLLSIGFNINDLWCDRGFSESVYKLFSLGAKARRSELIEQDWMTIINRLIGRGAKLVLTGEFEESLLASIFKYKLLNSSALVGYLYQLGFRLENRNQKGETLLLWALRHGDTHWLTVVNCLRYGSVFNTVDNNKNGPTYHAIKGRLSPANLRAFLLQNPFDWFVECEGRTVLHLAWEGGDFDLCCDLIEKGCNPNIVDGETGETLLMAAIRRKQDRLIRNILLKNPDLSLKDRRGRKAFAIAFDYDRLDLMIELMNRGGASFDVKKIDPPVEGIADRPRFVADGESLMTWSAMVPSAGISFIDMLLAKGASINMVNNSGETLLHYAIRSKRMDLIDYCFNHQADVNIKNAQGDSPLMYSLALGLDEISIKLIDKGARLYERNEYGFAPIDMVSEARFMPVQNPMQNEEAALAAKALAYCPLKLNAKEVEKSKTPTVYLGLWLSTEMGKKYENAGSLSKLKNALLKAIANQDDKFSSQILEVAMIFNLTEVSFTLAKKLGAEKFSEIFVPYIHKNSAVMPKKYWMSHLIYTTGKYVNGLDEASNSKAASANIDEPLADITQLLAYFDEINVNDPSRDDYFDPKALLKGEFLKLKNELKGNLEEFVTDVLKKKSNRKFKNPEEDFKTLHRLLSQLTRCCEKLDRRQRSIFILDIAQEAKNCSVGWMLTANNLKSLLDIQLGVEVKFENLESRLYHRLMLFRTGKIEMLSGAGVHNRNRWLQAIGQRINVSEANNLGEFKDAYKYEALNPTECYYKFLSSYHPFAICSLASNVVSETLKIERQQTEHSTVLHWFETHVPTCFRHSFYESIRSEIEKGESGWQTIFDKHNLVYNPAWKSPDAALEKARQGDYVSSAVFPKYSETPDLAAVFHLLKELQVLDESTPGIVDEATRCLKAAIRLDSKKRPLTEQT